MNMKSNTKNEDTILHDRYVTLLSDVSKKDAEIILELTAVRMPEFVEKLKKDPRVKALKLDVL